MATLTLTGNEPLVAADPAPPRKRAAQDTVSACYLLGIARGDADALGRLYDESSGLVYALTLRILGVRFGS